MVSSKAKPKSKSSAKARKRGRGPRASWKGQVRCGLVSFGVQAFNASAPERGEFYFHQLHAGCHQRIRHEKVCPVHGEVSQSDIVSGFEYAPGKYVEIDPEEIEAVRSEGERALTIEAFIKPDQLDPLYYDGRAYYLLPDGETAGEGYAVLREAMLRQEADGFGKVLFSGRDQLVRLRVADGLLLMAMLTYSAERKKSDEGSGVSRQARPAAKSVKLAEELVHSMIARDFDFDAYEDNYRDRMKELIDAKRAGREIVAPEAEEEPATINLMDALKKSLARGRSAAPSEDGRRHRGKSKESGRKRPSTKRQRRAS